MFSKIEMDYFIRIRDNYEEKKKEKEKERKPVGILSRWKKFLSRIPSPRHRFAFKLGVELIR